MIKFFLRFFLFLLVTIFLLAAYLYYFGITTDKFDSLIKDKANEVNQNVKLNFNKTKIHFNLKELNLVVRLQNPRIFIIDNEIDLSKLDLFLPLRSFFSSDFLLEKTEVAFEQKNIDDLTKVTRIFLPRFINKKIKKIIEKGNLEGEFVIPFESDGSIGKNYAFSGKIIDANINLTKQFKIRNLNTTIKHEKENQFEALITNGLLFNIDLSGTTINLINKNNIRKIKTLLHTKGNIDFPHLKKISSILGIDLSKFKNIEGKANLLTKIDFEINKKFKINNLSYGSNGDINYLKMETAKIKTIDKYFPNYNPEIIIKESKINFVRSKSNHITNLEGLIKFQEKFNTFKIKEIYDYNKKNFNVSGNVELTNSKVRFSNLNYFKKYGKKAELFIDVNFILNKYYNINKFSFLSDKNKINLFNVNLNKNFEVNKLNKIEVKTFIQNEKNNDFLVEKNDKLLVLGEVFDAKPILESLFKKTDKKIFSKRFKSEVKINFNKVLTGTNDDVFDLSMIASIHGGTYKKLSLKGNFEKNEIVEMSIYQVDNNKRTLQVISDRARPFIKNFDFIKGFEGGKLVYESIISKDVSNANLIITDFKVSKVPALAQLLTLASLQGIADTLSGEGIRFESFEMKSNSEGNIMNIEDALAMGPAVSILLNGYVDKGKIVSLRGTLVPATKLNSIIASIPLVGDILVGKKTGEGVVGVSFKMKGPPKDIKTTVNPIKTLTPRFIVRAVEKMKKKKKEDAK